MSTFENRHRDEKSSLSPSDNPKVYKLSPSNRPNASQNEDQESRKESRRSRSRSPHSSRRRRRGSSDRSSEKRSSHGSRRQRKSPDYRPKDENRSKKHTSSRSKSRNHRKEYKDKDRKNENTPEKKISDDTEHSQRRESPKKSEAKKRHKFNDFTDKIFDKDESEMIVAESIKKDDKIEQIETKENPYKGYINLMKKSETPIAEKTPKENVFKEAMGDELEVQTKPTKQKIESNRNLEKIVSEKIVDLSPSPNFDNPIPDENIENILDSPRISKNNEPTYAAPAPSNEKTEEPFEPEVDVNLVNHESELFKSRSGGVYLPPAKLKLYQNEYTDKSTEMYQRLYWVALKKAINGLMNKVNADNIVNIVQELLQENVIKGRGILIQGLINSQQYSPTYTNIFAALISVINTKVILFY